MRGYFCIHSPESEPPQEAQVKLMSMVVMVILVVVAVMMVMLVMMKVTMMFMMEMKSLYEQGQRKEETIRLRRGQAVHGKDVKLLS